ncbi:glycosyltransferase family 2 protein [Bifidobacterium eulemuris]|uniref:Glycosyltransferase n=1 Tax=Bifidobacterium eulemuris TaxID=1765219 RepID=A0A261FZF0_9BIFI|nr:glycosyltransferase [Bifidobacterium eulemuris]OZG64365.1 glycosyltransferase family 2 [Bifidobacterium eulemuris]QOL32434.1 glycosyltransferase [Bifidobacterium eulemuris]
MNVQPLVSLIVPVFNVENQLDRCISSIVGQSYRNLEIILVDDGSMDGCPEKCDQWALRDNRIRVIHKKNGGLSSARNAGLDVMRGEYVAFVDSDDYISSEYVSVLCQNGGDADLVICSFIKEDDAEACVEKALVTDHRKLLTPRECLRQAILDWHLIVAWNKLYPHFVWKDLRFPEGRIHEDEYVLHQILDRCSAVALLPDALYHYVSREDSITHKEGSIERLDRLVALVERLRYSFLKKYAECSEPILRKVFFESRQSYFDVPNLSDGMFRTRFKEIFRTFRMIPIECSKTLPTKEKIMFHILYFAPSFTFGILRACNRFSNGTKDLIGKTRLFIKWKI